MRPHVMAAIHRNEHNDLKSVTNINQGSSFAVRRLLSMSVRASWASWRALRIGRANRQWGPGPRAAGFHHRQPPRLGARPRMASFGTGQNGIASVPVTGCYRPRRPTVVLKKPQYRRRLPPWGRRPPCRCKRRASHNRKASCRLAPVDNPLAALSAKPRRECPLKYIFRSAAISAFQTVALCTADTIRPKSRLQR